MGPEVLEDALSLQFATDLLSNPNAITVRVLLLTKHQRSTHMQPSTVPSQPTSTRLPDRSIVEQLQDISRRLDMSTVANVDSIRRELTSLAAEGKISGPPAAEQVAATPESSLQALAQKMGWGNLNRMLDNLPATEILRRLRLSSEEVVEAPSFEQLTVPELDKFISEEIRFHSGVAEHEAKGRGKYSKHGRS